MTLSFWRYSHLVLALFSSIFLLLASVTGTILAIDAIQEKVPSYKVSNFDDIKLGQIVPVLQKNYSEITEITVDYNQFVTIHAIDKSGNNIQAYIDPNTGAILGTPRKKSEFIHWITDLHRSLFLKESGRLVIGLVSFVLVLISISGFVLVLKRQKGIWNFFSKIIKEYFAQYYHVVFGRLALIPILIIGLSGTYLSMVRFNLFTETKEVLKTEISRSPIKEYKDTSVLTQTLLSEVKKIEFPFSDDPEDYYIFDLNDRKIEVNQFSGTVVTKVNYPMTSILSELSLGLHTGRASILWAITLGLACLSILFFIYSGFAMTLKRRASRINNKYKVSESEYILLVGSENGSTLRFANAIYKQLVAHNKKVFIAQLNNYTLFPKASHIIVFASTHGLGDPPSNGTKFTSLVNKFSQKQNIHFSVVGFGSKAYPDFCGYAREIDTLLHNQNWAKRLLDLQTVNDKSAVEFVEWVKLWGQKTNLELSTTLSVYNHVPKGLQKFIVLEKTNVSETDQTFILTLRANSKTKFTSGDLLAIYPENDSRERLYSIGKHTGNIQLVIKLHSQGLGSSYLYNVKVGAIIKARILNNDAFHLPKKTNEVAMISNGTGIAPFLGMIEENKNQTPIHLYAGFRKKTEITNYYESFALKMTQKHRLKSFHMAFSREANHLYVMDLIIRDALFFKDVLQKGGTIMICGSLAMQQDVEKVLDAICQEKINKSLSEFKLKGQLLTDCY